MEGERHHGTLELACQPLHHSEVIVSSEDVATMVNYKILAGTWFEMLAIGGSGESESVFIQSNLCSLSYQIYLTCLSYIIDPIDLVYVN